jgi:uncharacterized Zn ribbon protein
MSTIQPTTCECGFDCADFISRHDIAMGARFECPVCGDARTVSSSQAVSEEIYGDANGVILADGDQQLTHGFR